MQLQSTRISNLIAFLVSAATLGVFLFLSAAFAPHRVQAFSASATQAAAAGLSGAILDPTGAVVADATVDLVAGGIIVATTVSREDGLYRFESVPPGAYQLHVRRFGFADQFIRMTGGEAAAVRNITLQIGGTSDTLVVTASRGPESRPDVTQAVSTLTAAEIQALGSASLADVVRFVPGLAVEAAGREGALTSLFSRGGDSDYNVVMIDGVRVNLDGGRFDFGRIGAGEIDRVEVVRGAQSALWGSDAMGSVVQVFTSRARATDPVRFQGSIEGGSFNSWRGELRLAGGARRQIDYQAGVTHRRSGGAFARILPERDRFEQLSADAALGFTLGGGAGVRAGLRYSSSEGRSVGPVNYGFRDSGTIYDSKDLSVYANLIHNAGNRLNGVATVNYFHHDSLSADTVADPPFDTYAVLTGTPNAIFPGGTRLVRLIGQSEFNALAAAGATPAPGQFLASRSMMDSLFSAPAKFRRPALRYQADYAWAEGQRFSAGYDWERETNPLVDGFALDNHALFIQQHSTIAGRWFATAGARVDRKESYNTFFSPKLSLGGYLLPFNRGAVSSLKVFGNLGRGVKTATFAERFGAGFADPNSDIRVERARSADAGVEATFADQRFRGTIVYFDNKFFDQISYRPGDVGDGIPEFINIDGSRARGWELELGLQRSLAGFSAAATFARVNTRVVTNQSTGQQFQPGQPLLRRPRNSGTLRMSYTSGRLTAEMNTRAVGRRHDNSFLSLRTVPNAARPAAVTTDITVNPSYTVTGVGVSFRIDRSTAVFARFDNVTDTKWEGVLGYPGLPRAVVAGVRFGGP